MSPATRRLWLFGLLLVLPALAIGGLALGLLAREQARLAEREAAARDTRRAAVEARARLIAENIELLLGDVQSALMNTLLEAPSAEPRPFLSEWQANNPLVREVFRATAEGRPVWGAAGDPLRAWLAQGAPWASPLATLAQASERAPEDREAKDSIAAFAPAPAAPPAPVLSSAPEPVTQARRDISTNVVQYQRARQEIQEVAKLRNQADVAAKASNEAQILGGSSFAASLAPSPSAVAGEPASADVLAEAASQSLVFDAAPLDAVEGGAGFSAPAVEPTASPPVRLDAPLVQTPPPPLELLTRSGWTPWRGDDGLHVFGWRELPDRTVIGLELRLDAIKARLGEVFPAAPEPGEAYALRDAEGRLWHRVGPQAELPTVLEVPLSAAALPGWSILAQTVVLDASAYSSAPGGVFALGATLIALLVFTILAAGALLVWQARRSEAEAALKTSFVANVSHELKTPLTTIRLYAELLAQGRVRDEAKRADYLATIGQETQRLARLVGNVLDFSRLEQGKKRFEPAAFDLAAELRRLGAMHAPRLAAAGLALHVEAPESLRLTSDREAIEQILLNLLDNACKYAAEGGEVLLAATPRPDGAARVTVADRGPGVPDGQRERIFEKFHRVDDRLTAEKGGAGLGLSIARQLARGLGGELACEAREGGGAAFVLTLAAN